VAGEAISPLFEATVEATEEAVVNSLFRAETVHGYRGTVVALPVDSVVTILREHRVIP
jgi:D-aminopeptidase